MSIKSLSGYVIINIIFEKFYKIWKTKTKSKIWTNIRKKLSKKIIFEKFDKIDKTKKKSQILDRYTKKIIALKSINKLNYDSLNWALVNQSIVRINQILQNNII